MNPKFKGEMNCECQRAVALLSGGFRGGAQGVRAPLFVEYLQKIYKKMTEMSIQKPF